MTLKDNFKMNFKRVFTLPTKRKKVEIIKYLKANILYECSVCGYHQYPLSTMSVRCKGCGNVKWTYTDGWKSLTKQEFIKMVKKNPKFWGINEIKLGSLLKALP